MSKSTKTIAVIGTGIMGHGIADNFLKKGYKVIVWNRSKEKLEDLIAQGAISADSPKNAAAQADIVFEVTANDASSRAVWLGKAGILAGARPHTFLIASATLSIPWIDELAKETAQQQRIFIDIPLTGGRIAAETGKLIFLVGADEKRLKPIEPDLKTISSEILYFGKVGSGMRFKLILNMMQAIHIVSFGEAMRLAKTNGLDIKKIGSALAQRPGGTATSLAWRDYQNEPNPINFSVEWINKDLTYAKQFAGTVPTPFLDEVLQQFHKLLENHLGAADWTKINKL